MSSYFRYKKSDMTLEEFLWKELKPPIYSVLSISLSNSRVEIVAGNSMLRYGSAFAEFHDGKYLLISNDCKYFNESNYLDITSVDDTTIKLENGNRWHGYVCDGKPCGFGTEVDKNWTRVYEGYRVGNVNVLSGTTYYPDSGEVEYSGEFVNGKRWGEGGVYDQNGYSKYNGNWVNDAPFDNSKVMTVTPENEKTILLHSQLEELVISDDSCNDDKWNRVDFHWLMRLKKITIGDNCFKCAKTLSITDMRSLESLKIGNNSFLNPKDDGQQVHLAFNCYLNKKLECIEIGEFSFRYFKGFDLISAAFPPLSLLDLPTLTTLSIGTVGSSSCCFYSSDFSLNGHLYHPSLQ